MTLKPTLKLAAGLLAGLAIGSMESDSFASFCFRGMDHNTWTLEVTDVSIEGNDPVLLQSETARWAEAQMLDFDPEDWTVADAWIEQVLFETEYGVIAKKIEFVQTDATAKE